MLKRFQSFQKIVPVLRITGLKRWNPARKASVIVGLKVKLLFKR